MCTWFWRLLLWPIGFLVSAAGLATAEVSEYDVKAAFVFNFTKFVQFPEPQESDIPFMLCLAGDAEALRPFQQLRGKVVGQRTIDIRFADTPDQARGCQVLFIARTTPVAAVSLLAATARTAVLTVGESDTFLDSGGMIQFMQEGGRIRFAIRKLVADAAGIIISSKLLALAKVEE